MKKLRVLLRALHVTQGTEVRAVQGVLRRVGAPFELHPRVDRWLCRAVQKRRLLQGYHPVALLLRLLRNYIL